MVDFIIMDFESVRGGGNIIDTVPSAEDFIVNNCTISSVTMGEFVLTPGESLVGNVWLSANPTSITVGESVVFSAFVEDTDGEPLEGLTVSFYRDGVSLGSGVSDDSGLVQLTVSSWSVGSFTCTASCQGVSSSGVTVTVSKVASTISLSAQSGSVIVGSDVVLNGTLSVGSGESVKIYQGTTLIDTVTTGTDGAFSKTVSGLSAGTYTFKATYDGDSTHASAESSTVSVTVGNKPVPSISLGASSSSITVGNSVTMSGQLVYGSTALSNASVKIYNGSTLVDTVSTNSQGYYTKSVSGLTVGTHSFTAVFEGDSSYAGVTSSNVVITVSAPVVDSVSLTADKSILSAYDSEYATLTATVLDQSSNPMSGETVSFDIVSGGSVVENIGTAQTNSSGVATVSYYAEGTGDLSIQASVGMIVSETCSLEDCTYYSTTEYTISPATLNIPLPSTFSLEYVMKQTDSNNSVPYLDIGASSNNRMLVGQYARAGGNGLIVYKSSSTTYAYTSNPTVNQENTVHFTYDGTNYTYWLNSLTPMAVSDKGVTLTKLIHVENAAGGYLKNIKIKPL